MNSWGFYVFVAVLVIVAVIMTGCLFHVGWNMANPAPGAPA